jgi:S1-C subfamily serine protease
MHNRWGRPAYPAARRIQIKPEEMREMDDIINTPNHDQPVPADYISGAPVGGPTPEHRQAAAPAPAAPTADKPPRPRRVGFFPGLLIVATLLLSMVFGGVGAEVALLASGHPAATTTTATTATTAPSNSTYSQSVAQVSPETISAIYKKVSPSVVMIDSMISTSGRFRAGGEATGTGIVVDAQGNILTNYHVIQNATSIKVELADGSTYPATVVGAAAQDDLAVVHADIPVNKLVPATLGDSASVQVGDAVIAVGYPFGLDQSVTAGIVSGLNRDSGGTSSRTLSGLIQTDAAINPGNSGGPLLNTDGQVIGINTMIESPIEAFTGIGLAIPIDHAKQLLPQITQGAQVERPWIGISGTEITASLAAQYHLPVSQGILVAEVVSGGPAATAGLRGSTLDSQETATQIGDIITAVDGQAVGSVAALTSYLNGKQPGDQITLTILRDGQQQRVPVTLQPWPASTTGSSN